MTCLNPGVADVTIRRPGAPNCALVGARFICVTGHARAPAGNRSSERAAVAKQKWANNERVEWETSPGRVYLRSSRCPALN